MESDILEISNERTSKDFAWDECPPELLFMILDKINMITDPQTFLNCLAVNRRWWNIISPYIENRIGQDDFLDSTMPDSAASFRKRSAVSSISNLLSNLCLWKNISYMTITDNYAYDLTDVLNMNVYKENLIVVTNRNVKYYNLKTYELLKTLPLRCINFDENDNMFVKVDETKFDMDHVILEEMTLYGKPTTSSAMDDRYKFTSKIKFFRIYDNYCYYTTWAFTIFLARWDPDNNGWTNKLVGRYFGYGIITDVMDHNREVVALLNWGGMLVADLGTSRLKLVSREKTSVIFELPMYATRSILYDRNGVIVVVPSNRPLNLSSNGVYWVLECPDLICSLKHGNMLLLGYRNGKVEIYNPEHFSSKSRSLKPEVTITVQSLAPFDYDLFDASVRHLEVAEVDGAHVLIIATSIYVHQIRLTHR